MAIIEMKVKLKFFFIVALLTGVVFGMDSDSLRYKNNPNYKLQMEMQNAYKTRSAKIVMLGNSLTHGANWNEILGRNGVVERGIPGDILEGFVSRLDGIYNLKPEIVFVMGGLNDIYGWIPIEEVYQNYLKVINGLEARKIKVVIQSTTYGAKDYAKDYLAQNNPEVNVHEYNRGRNQEVDRLNKLLKAYAQKNGIDFIDMNSKVAKGNFLRDDVTHDGIHFNAKGYEIWATEIDKVLKKYRM